MSKISYKLSALGNLRPAQSPLLSLVMLAGIVSLAGSAQAQTLSAQSGTATAAVHHVVNLGALPQISAAELAVTPQVKPLPGVDPLTFAALKAQAAAIRFPTPQGAVTAPPAIPQQGISLTPTATSGWLSTNEIGCGFSTPPDQALAVGSGSGAGVGAVLQGMNVCLDVYDKNGGLLAGYPKSLTSFLFLPAGTYVTDPRAIYDWINHRYIFVAQDCPGDTNLSQCYTNNGGFYNIAVSTGDDPNGSYCIYRLGVQSVSPSGGAFPFPDFPRIGQDRQAIYLAANIFFPNNNTFKWEEVMALPKAQMYACQGISFPFWFNLNFGGVLTDTTQPANVYSAGDQPRSEFMVGAKNFNFGGGSCSGGCNGLFVWAWYDPFNTTGSGNTLNGVAVGTTNNYSFPPNAVQQGTTTTIQTDSTFISGTVVYSAGTLYAAHTSNGGSGQPNCILYDIKPYVTYGTGAISSAEIQNEIVFGGGANSWYYCTQQPDPGGNVTTVFNFSGSTFYAGLAYITRRAEQPKGGFGASDGGVFLVGGQGTYTEGRWGDYSATSIAGLVSGGGTGGFPAFWFAGMYATNISDGGGGHIWGSAIGRNGYNAISQP